MLRQLLHSGAGGLGETLGVVVTRVEGPEKQGGVMPCGCGYAKETRRLEPWGLRNS